MNFVRKQFSFGGYVQGVGFRYTAMRYAQELGLTGWVKNEWNDTVTMEVQGSEEAIEMLIHKLKNRRPIRIERMGVLDLPLEIERGFHVR